MHTMCVFVFGYIHSCVDYERTRFHCVCWQKCVNLLADAEDELATKTLSPLPLSSSFKSKARDPERNLRRRRNVFEERDHR